MEISTGKKWKIFLLRPCLDPYTTTTKRVQSHIHVNFKFVGHFIPIVAAYLIVGYSSQLKMMCLIWWAVTQIKMSFWQIFLLNLTSWPLKETI